MGSGTEQKRGQAVADTIVADHEISARADEPVAFPGVDPLALDLIASHRDRHTAGALHLLDLYKTVAEAQEFLAVQLLLAQDALDNHLLGEVPIIVERSIDVLPEVRSQTEQLGLAAHKGNVGPAGEVEPQAAAAQVLEESVAAWHRPLLGLGLPVRQRVDAAADSFHEQ